MRIANKRFQFLVEGKCEKKLIRVLIDHHLIVSGKAEIINPIQETIKITHLRPLPDKTNIILVFDTDKPETDIFKKNLEFLKSSPNIQSIITVPQVRNLEEELIRCTDIRHIRDLINCSHDSDFKAEFIEEKRLFEKLLIHHFDFKKLWSSSLPEPFLSLGIQNQGGKIKLP